jgi:hypothetical protein
MKELIYVGTSENQHVNSNEVVEYILIKPKARFKEAYPRMCVRMKAAILNT